MILGMSLATFTILHVAISLIGIGTGLIVLLGLLSGKLLSPWNGIFLLFTILTSVTGFLFPYEKVTPGIILGVLSMIALIIALGALRLPSQRNLAHHLCRHCADRSLLQLLRPHRADLYEGSLLPCSGPNRHRNALQDRSTPPSSHHHRPDHDGSEKIPLSPLGLILRSSDSFQFSVGLVMWSTTRLGTDSCTASSLSPSCSCTAVKIEGQPSGSLADHSRPN
jgi:hypothetical protein